MTFYMVIITAMHNKIQMHTKAQR